MRVRCPICEKEIDHAEAYTHENVCRECWIADRRAALEQFKPIDVDIERYRERYHTEELVLDYNE